VSKKTADRRAAAEKIRVAQKNAERRRGMVIVVVCLALAVGIVGAALYQSNVPFASKNWWDARRFAKLELAGIGAPASSCEKATTKPAEGEQDHENDLSVPLTYEDSPPAFGKHYAEWEDIERKLYAAADRPPLGKLVHNQEHGYTILWYDETAAGDDEMMDDIRAIAAKFKGDDANFRMKFKAAPWLKDDGKPFPSGQHVAFTHWSNGGTGDAATGQKVGVTQFCAAPSGEALKTFMDKYPYVDSPEPGAGDMGAQ
jgi:hypothetical protein